MVVIKNWNVNATRTVILGSVTAATCAFLWWLFRSRRWCTLQSERGDRSRNQGDDSPLPSHIERDLYKTERRMRLLPLITRKKPMYDNVLMQDPQGNPLATISKKKAQWYLSKGLADWVEQTSDSDRFNTLEHHKPQSILRLRFQPRNRSLDPSEAAINVYNVSTKSNRCVVCGAGKNYMRHYIVPFCYRTLFPDSYKNHLSHDVVLTCIDCHIAAEHNAQRRRKKLEAALRKDPSTAAAFVVDRRKRTISKKALALLNHSDRMPLNRVTEYRRKIREYHNLSDGETLTKEILVKTSEMSATAPNPSYIAGPVLVVSPLLEEMQRDSGIALAEFIRAWRAYFIETSLPRYLPTGWSVENPVQCQNR